MRTGGSVVLPVLKQPTDACCVLRSVRVFLVQAAVGCTTASVVGYARKTTSSVWPAKRASRYPLVLALSSLRKEGLNR